MSDISIFFLEVATVITLTYIEGDHDIVTLCELLDLKIMITR